MRRLLGWIVGLLSLAALVRLIGRRRDRGSVSEPVPPPPPAEPVAGADTAEPAASLGERRADVHDHARATIAAMRDRPADSDDND